MAKFYKYLKIYNNELFCRNNNMSGKYIDMPNRNDTQN